MTDDELKTYEPIDFDPEEYRKEIGTKELLYPDKVGTLTHRWRYPSLSIHGIDFFLNSFSFVFKLILMFSPLNLSF